LKGTLRETGAVDLAHHVVAAAATGLDADLIDDVILAEGLHGAGVIARHAVITAALTDVPDSLITGTAPQALPLSRPSVTGAGHDFGIWSRDSLAATGEGDDVNASYRQVPCGSGQVRKAR
jgi:hypothetical protein